MKAFDSPSNDACFDKQKNMAKIALEDDIVFELKPYRSFSERFKQVLNNKDPFLVHLMLKQASHAKNRPLARKLLKSLVNHATNV